MVATTILTAAWGRREQATTLGESAYCQIRELIITLELPPASLIDEEQLVARLGVGHTPIREALRRLAHEGLVVILPRRGTLVADVNMSDLYKVFELRLELEPFAAQLAAQRATPAQLDAMHALFADNAAVLANGSNVELMHLDHEAHRQLAQAAGNEFLETTLERLYTHVLRLWYVSLHTVGGLREALDEHRAIVAAVAQGDGAQAAQMMRDHIVGFQTQFTKTR
jgi:DNA-binding GntR family transcriptional regulator